MPWTWASLRARQLPPAPPQRASCASHLVGLGPSTPCWPPTLPAKTTPCCQTPLCRGVPAPAALSGPQPPQLLRFHADIAQFLIDRGADVHADDDEAIQEASANGHDHIVHLLLQHGANLPTDADKALLLASG